MVGLDEPLWHSLGTICRCRQKHASLLASKLVRRQACAVRVDQEKEAVGPAVTVPAQGICLPSYTATMSDVALFIPGGRFKFKFAVALVMITQPFPPHASTWGIASGQ